MKVINEAKEWSKYARHRFSIYGNEHTGVYFKPSMAKSLDHLDALIVEIEHLRGCLLGFRDDLKNAPEFVHYEKDVLANWLESLIGDQTR